MLASHHPREIDYFCRPVLQGRRNLLRMIPLELMSDTRQDFLHSRKPLPV
jgi:hypothetical protein